jgi:hypothetical protein
VTWYPCRDSVSSQWLGIQTVTRDSGSIPWLGIHTVTRYPDRDSVCRPWLGTRTLVCIMYACDSDFTIPLRVQSRFMNTLSSGLSGNLVPFTFEPDSQDMWVSSLRAASEIVCHHDIVWHRDLEHLDSHISPVLRTNCATKQRKQLPVVAMILHYFLVIIMLILVCSGRCISLFWHPLLPLPFVMLLPCFITINVSHLPLSAQTVVTIKHSTVHTRHQPPPHHAAQDAG